jgi:hypothetical protein
MPESCSTGSGDSDARIVPEVFDLETGDRLPQQVIFHAPGLLGGERATGRHQIVSLRHLHQPRSLVE